MLGSSAVGKTSLVSRFVHSLFSEKYHTTIGVKIDKKTVRVAETNVTLILWDLHGDDEFQRVRDSYLRGAAGYLLIVDGTRRSTLGEALALRQRVLSSIGDVPFLLLLNKADLKQDWELEEEDLNDAATQAFQLETSAKTGAGVEKAFLRLAEMMVN
jgi:small GTP-binding protein